MIAPLWLRLAVADLLGESRMTACSALGIAAILAPLLVLAGLREGVVEGMRPYPRSLRNIALWGNVYMVVVTLLNLAIGSNYLFTAHKPPTASLLDVLPPWPWYIAVIELLAVFFVCLFYAPFWIKDLVQRKQAGATQPL